MMKLTKQTIASTNKHSILLEQQPDLILFDWDLTLAESGNFIINCMTEALEENGYSHKIPLYLENCHRSGPDLMQLLIKEEDREKVLIAFRTRHSASHLDNIKIMDGALELLDITKELAIKTSIVSNKTALYLKKEVSHLKLDDYFLSIVGAGEAKRNKPHPDPALLAISHLKNNSHIIDTPQNIWFIGDSDMDYHCARSIDALPILVHSDFDFPDAVKLPSVKEVSLLLKSAKIKSI